MGRSWTFGQKLGGGFAVIVALALAGGVIAILALRSVVEGKDRVINSYARYLVDAERMRGAIEAKGAANRGYLFTGEERFLEERRAALSEFESTLTRLKTQVGTEEGRELLHRIEAAAAEHQAASDEAVARRGGQTSLEEVARNFEEVVVPKRKVLDQQLDAFVDRQETLLAEGARGASETSSWAVALLIGIVLATAVSGAGIAVFLTKALTRQIGSAVQHVQSSSSELQAAASQQATGTREQSTAMNEITVTINELLATSKQIAESARRVAQIAGQSASAAQGGNATVRDGQDAIRGIKQQVDLVVGHMLELGKKAQQIGGILEIINELAEQTNILAINATIEAAGAGDTGKRFAVVADEIRKLADRVAGSTKEIRGLIDETRAAVHTTVMATETGSKAVDAGTRQFGEVAVSFSQIADLVKVTTEAAREIELSTKQQATAVEQVNAAIADVAQTTKETESSSNQTAQTASQLATLSRDLSRFIQSQANA
jgi:methyl-accepting chemotaxis protein